MICEWNMWGHHVGTISSSLWEIHLRKHLYPSGPKSYPTLAQKHFNASDSWPNETKAIWYHTQFLQGWVALWLAGAQEAVILAKWLETICLDVASRDPTDEHKAFLGHFIQAPQNGQLMFSWFPRLRAAVFVNLVGMRRALSSPQNGYLDLTPANLAALQRANYLFHCAHNWSLSKWFFSSMTYVDCSSKLWRWETEWTLRSVTSHKWEFLFSFVWSFQGWLRKRWYLGSCYGRLDRSTTSSLAQPVCWVSAKVIDRVMFCFLY